MQRTKTARLYAEDIDRAQMLAAVRQETPQQLLHAALSEFIETHRDELDASFRRVQEAVLSNDLAETRRIFREAGRASASQDARRIQQLIADSGS
jgi:hypothetical protein